MSSLGRKREERLRWDGRKWSLTLPKIHGTISMVLYPVMGYSSPRVEESSPGVDPLYFSLHPASWYASCDLSPALRKFQQR